MIELYLAEDVVLDCVKIKWIEATVKKLLISVTTIAAFFVYYNDESQIQDNLE